MPIPVSAGGKKTLDVIPVIFCELRGQVEHVQRRYRGPPLSRGIRKGHNDRADEGNV